MMQTFYFSFTNANTKITENWWCFKWKIKSHFAVSEIRGILSLSYLDQSSFLKKIREYILIPH